MLDGGRTDADALRVNCEVGAPAEDIESRVVALAGGVGEAEGEEEKEGEAILRAETDARDEMRRRCGECARTMGMGMGIGMGMDCVSGGSRVLAWVGVVARTADIVLSVRGRGVGRDRGGLIRMLFPALRGRRDPDVDGREPDVDGRELAFGAGTGSSCAGWGWGWGSMSMEEDALAACRSSDSLSCMSGMIDAAPSFARTLSSCEWVTLALADYFGWKK